MTPVCTRGRAVPGAGGHPRRGAQRRAQRDDARSVTHEAAGPCSAHVHAPNITHPTLAHECRHNSAQCCAKPAAVALVLQDEGEVVARPPHLSVARRKGGHDGSSRGLFPTHTTPGASSGPARALISCGQPWHSHAPALQTAPPRVHAAVTSPVAAKHPTTLNLVWAIAAARAGCTATICALTAARPGPKRPRSLVRGLQALQDVRHPRCPVCQR